MAHTRPYIRECWNKYCSKKATVEVLDNRNTSWGFFCTKHGNEKVKQMTKDGY